MVDELRELHGHVGVALVGAAVQGRVEGGADVPGSGQAAHVAGVEVVRGAAREEKACVGFGVFFSWWWWMQANIAVPRRGGRDVVTKFCFAAEKG